MMRLTIATVLLAASLVAQAHPDSPARGHDAIAKRHRGRALVEANTTDVPALVKFDGDHDLDDVPEGYEYTGTPDDDASLFSGGFEDDWHHELPYEFDPHDNGTTAVLDPELTARELEERASYPKRGIAWTNEVAPGMAQFKNGKAFGLYSWTEWRPAECSKYNIRFFPMLKTYEKRDKFKNAVNKASYASGWIMGPNEVNLASQANMDPGRAAWIHRTYLRPLKKKYGWKIVGPSTANGQSALNWYDKLRKDHPDVFNEIDAINLHYYGLDYKLVQNWLDTWYARYRKHVWLTEYACHSFTGKGSCSQTQATTFMREIAKFCERKSWCDTYMIYGMYVNSRTGVSKVNAIFSSGSGALSALGKAYLAS